MSNNEEVKNLAKEVIFEARKQQQDKRLHNTKLLLKNYKKLKQHVDTVNTDNYLGYFDEEISGIVEGYDDGLYLKSLMRTKARTSQMLACIDISLAIVKKEYEGKQASYVFEAFEMYFFERKTYKEIADEYYSSKSSVERWIKEVVNKINLLLWGVEAFGL
ncbi:hypothetical protein [Intestinibacter bartlettii]|uniref:hypothetical protein n=1 Tax=Intestinibacter bartlettii TaxID=261299 RepID=UPI0008218785|nr:hypothetical protein [Intestinibacter bartlettii]SCJ11516.1 Uncharacterised protein [uncultured Clostridium sp.]